MAAIRTKPPLDGSRGEIYQGHSATAKDQQHQIEQEQAMQYHGQHSRQQTDVLQKAGRTSGLRIERQGFEDGGGVLCELIDLIIGFIMENTAGKGQREFWRDW